MKEGSFQISSLRFSSVQISRYTRYSEKRFTQIYRALYGDAMLQGVYPDGRQQGSRKRTETLALLTP